MTERLFVGGYAVRREGKFGSSPISCQEMRADVSEGLTCINTPGKEGRQLLSA